MAKYFISPPGLARYPWVNAPDTKFDSDGSFKIDLVVEGEAAEALAARIEEAGKEAFEEKLKELPPKDRPKFSLYTPYEYETDDEGIRTGRILFKFRQNAKIKLKSGEKRDVKIGIYDSRGEPSSAIVRNGSTVRVSYTIRPILISAAKTVGVRLDFGRVQIIRLAQGGGSGFEAYDGEDGYVEPDAPEGHSSPPAEGHGADGSDY